MDRSGGVPWAQTAPWHELLVQSLLALQLRPAAHGSQVPPPQSTPVSLPLRALSLQSGGAQWLSVPGAPLVQTWLVQSEALRQRFSSSQGLQWRPPQSTSLSSPLRKVSSQVEPQSFAMHGLGSQ